MLNGTAQSRQSDLNLAMIPNHDSAYGFQETFRPSFISADYTPYEVKSGDTPSQIAESQLGHYRRWPEILQSDGTAITPEEAKRLQVKELLWLPTFAPKSPALPKNTTIIDPSPNPITNQGMPEGYRKYFVQPGDTPSKIAESQLGNWRSWTDILQTDSTRIEPRETTKLQINEELWIPKASQPEETLSAALVATIKLSTEFYEYSIQAKDTRESIANKLWSDATLANLLIDSAGNLVTSNVSLKVGEKLIIPVSTLPANIFKAVGLSLPFSSVINRSLLTKNTEAAVRYLPIIQKIASDFFSKPEIRGKLNNEIGFKAETQISKALEEAGYKIFDVTPYVKNKGFDAIVMAPNGDVEFFEYKTTSKTGKAAEIEKLLATDKKGLKQTSLEWIVDRARRNLPKNSDPVVRQILADAIKNPVSINYKGVVAEKGTQTVRIFERTPNTPNFVEKTTPVQVSTGVKPNRNSVDDLAKNIEKKIFSASDDLAEGATKGISKTSKAIKAVGIIGTVAGLALDGLTLKNAYDADGGKFDKTFKEEAAGVAGSWVAATGGAAFGATVGTMIAGPGVGTLVGGLVGGVIGGIRGTDIGKDAYKSGLFKWWW
jgi:hypothetical protein